MKFGKRYSSFKILIALYTSYQLNFFQESPVVVVNEGPLRGMVQKLYDGSEYYSFKGIPYAQPPVGKLRFKVNKITRRSIK